MRGGALDTAWCKVLCEGSVRLSTGAKREQWRWRHQAKVAAGRGVKVRGGMGWVRAGTVEQG